MGHARKVGGSQSGAGRSWKMGSHRGQPKVHTNEPPESGHQQMDISSRFKSHYRNAMPPKTHKKQAPGLNL